MMTSNDFAGIFHLRQFERELTPKRSPLCRCGVSACMPACVSPRSASRSSLGQGDDETTAAAFTRLAAHHAAMALDDLLDEAQSQADATRPLGMARQPIKGFEDAFAQLGRHARSAIAHAQLD